MPTKGRPQVAVRMDPEEIAEVDRLAELASTPLRAVSRADVLRRALALGLEQVRAEIEGQPGKGGKRRRGR